MKTARSFPGVKRSERQINSSTAKDKNEVGCTYIPLCVFVPWQLCLSLLFPRVFFLICFYCFQPVFYHPGIPQGIHGVLQWVFTVMFAVYMKSIVRFIFLGRHLGGLGRCVWGSLWCWRCLCEIAEPRVGGEIWGPPGGLLTISCILAAGGGPFVQSLLDSCSMEMSSCSSCVGMSGSYRGLLRTGWEGNWAIG